MKKMKWNLKFFQWFQSCFCFSSKNYLASPKQLLTRLRILSLATYKVIMFHEVVVDLPFYFSMPSLKVLDRSIQNSSDFALGITVISIIVFTTWYLIPKCLSALAQAMKLENLYLKWENMLQLSTAKAHCMGTGSSCICKLLQHSRGVTDYSHVFYTIKRRFDNLKSQLSSPRSCTSRRIARVL